MKERKQAQQDALKIAPISDVLIPFEDARVILSFDSQAWQIGAMREEELITLYEDDKLRRLPFKEVLVNFLGAMTPRILKDTLQGIPFELEGKVFEGFRVSKDPGIIIAGYLIDFTKIVDPQKASYEETVRAIAEAADFLNLNRVPLLEKVSMDWHYMLGRCFGAAFLKPDASMNPEEAIRFARIYLEALPKEEHREQAINNFARGLVGVQVNQASSQIIP